MAFTARYTGTCARNRDHIYVGDIVEYNAADRLVHVECDIEADARADAAPDDNLTDLDRDALRPVCPRCFLIQPCGCDD